MQLACERQVYKIRLAYYRAVLHQDIGWFDLNASGELTSRLNDDVDKIHDGIGDKLTILVQWVTTFFAGFVIGFIRGWELTLVLIAITPFMVMGAAVFSKVAASFTSQEQKLYAGAGAIAEEVLSSVRTVVAFGGEYKEVDRYKVKLADASKLGAKKGASVGTSLALVFFFIFFSYALAFWFGGYLISIERIFAGDMLAVFFAVLIGAFSLGQAGPNAEGLIVAAGAAGEVFDTIDREEEWDKDIPDVSLMRVMKANAPEWWLIGLGLIGSLFLGAMNPLFAVFFGEIIEVFARPASEVLDGLHLWAGLFLALGFAAAAGTFLKSFCFTVAGENLTARLREWSFRAILRQEIGWFDNERNSSGILATRLAQDASRVQGATGSRLGTLIETFVGMVASIIIAFVYSWMLTLVLIGFVPVFIISGILEVKALTGHAGDNKKALEQAGKIAVDTIENMRTVASLGVEIKFYTAYNIEIKGPYKKNLVNSFVYGLTYGFSQSVIYLGFILTFGFGAYQVTRPPGHIAHESFSDLLTVLMAVIF
uniref:ABC transmembrane type-1 domain-containing protein n=1 Tax=Amphimedon queenslandica TaxID=400682 RepID=A0A1X7TB27_AMPQE